VKGTVEEVSFRSVSQSVCWLLEIRECDLSKQEN
jgi:hypothetical protein